MSAIGPKQTWARAPHMSAFGGKADMTYCGANVCFWPKADIHTWLGVRQGQDARTCPLGPQNRRKCTGEPDRAVLLQSLARLRATADRWRSPRRGM